MATSTLKKVVTTHPGSESEMKIDEKIIAIFKTAVLQSLKSSKVKIFTELSDD